MEKYDVTVVDYRQKRLIGMKVRTTMQNAQADCPALFERFGPRMGELPPGSCYGVSVMVNAEELDYWAALPAEADTPVPDGMECIEVLAGQYAKCKVANLEELGGVYMYMYTEWGKSQPRQKYTVDEWLPCFELYPENWNPAAAFEVFVPVKKLH